MQWMIITQQYSVMFGHLHYTRVGRWRRVIRFQRDSRAAHEGHNEKQTLSLYSALPLYLICCKVAEKFPLTLHGNVPGRWVKIIIIKGQCDDFFSQIMQIIVNMTAEEILIRCQVVLFSDGGRGLYHTLITFIALFFYDIMINEIRWSKTLTIIRRNY